MSALQNISTVGDHCFGCTACVHICPTSCIAMIEDNQGFLYPNVDETLCIDCGRCVGVCPYYNCGDAGSELFPETFSYAAKHLSETERMASSSGGAFTAISDYVLKGGGVVYGAAYDSSLNVRHIRVDNIEERDSLRGSKYVQSDLGNVFGQVADDLRSGTTVLFSGTPCQIAGLRLFLGTQQTHLITVDLVCKGVPSPKLFSDYLFGIGQKHGRIIDCNFRHKRNGWSHLTLQVTSETQSFYYRSYESSFYSLFLRGYSLRSCCYECCFANLNRPADITIGDYWGIDSAHPGFNDEKGVSLVLINSNKGKAVWDIIKGSMEYIESTHDACMQNRLYQPISPNSQGTQFWEDYKEKGYAHVARRYGSEGLKKKMRRAVKKLVVKTPLMNVYRKITTFSKH